jgi:FkbM family methyltransferase
VLHLHPTGDRWVSDEIRNGVEFERHVLRVLLLLLEPGATLVDVGANLGWFTVIGSRLVGPTGRVVAYEPDPGNLRLLRRNIRANDCRNVTVIAAAAGETRGRARLWLSPDNQGDHRLELSSDRADWVDVDVRRVTDDVKPGVAALVKIDVQGSEVAALRGMQPLLAATPAPRLVAELWPHGLERCGASADELIDLLCQDERRLWLARHDGTLTELDGRTARLTAETEFAPESERHADLVSVHPQDQAAIAALEHASTER